MTKEVTRLHLRQYFQTLHLWGVHVPDLVSGALPPKHKVVVPSKATGLPLRVQALFLKAKVLPLQTTEASKVKVIVWLFRILLPKCYVELPLEKMCCVASAQHACLTRNALLPSGSSDATARGGGGDGVGRWTDSTEGKGGGAVRPQQWPFKQVPSTNIYGGGTPNKPSQPLH